MGASEQHQQTLFDPEEVADRQIALANSTVASFLPNATESEFIDPFDDDTPLACGIENPDHCDSCQ